MSGQLFSWNGLTVRIALANFFNRLNDALQIELEPGIEALF